MGFSSSDDAGIYRLDNERALVLSADFITPPVDDPWVYGQIAAANALSDIYAMGGRPLVCLHLACFPTGKLDEGVIGRIFEGSMAKVGEAGAVVAGGHTVEDEEPKFGLSVTGIVHPQQVWTNAGAKPGDAIILTKPIGSGVLFNANLKKAVSTQALDECVDQLIRLNEASARILADYPIHAVTDVTGFGLAGHAYEMASGSGVTIRIDSNSVPLYREAMAMYERGITTGSNKNNRAQVEGECSLGALSASMQELMVDPQTSGGLLVALPADIAGQALESLQRGGVETARIIGRVTEYSTRRIEFV